MRAELAGKLLFQGNDLCVAQRSMATSAVTTSA
jgi:hypothetical protein